MIFGGRNAPEMIDGDQRDPFFGLCLGNQTSRLLGLTPLIDGMRDTPPLTSSVLMPFEIINFRFPDFVRWRYLFFRIYSGPEAVYRKQGSLFICSRLFLDTAFYGKPENN